MFGDELRGVPKFYKYEKHTTKKYFYENPEYLSESIDERTIGHDYIEILRKIEDGKIDPKNLGLKM
jgi:hypothetical protein